MAGAADILAGRAAVELLMKDAGFSKGVDAASKKFQSAGKGFAIIGAAITATGAAIVAPLVEITRQFASAGAAIVNMSSRTHESTANLLLFQYAAEETGTELEKVQQAIFKTQKEGKNFDQLATQIGAIKDPAKQSTAAIEAFGKKAGGFLVPMLRDLPKLREEFNRLGLAKGMGTADLKNAKELNTSFLDLGAVIKSVRNVIGAALAPTIKGVVDLMTRVVMTVRGWIDQNRELFVTALKIGGALMAAGAAITGVGLALTLAGTAIGGFNGLLGVAASVLAALVSPIGLVVGAVAGLATWFVTSTTYGRQMVTALAGWFGELRDIAVEAFGGIADALTAGNLGLAAQIAMAGIQLVWVNGLNELRTLWAGFVEAGNEIWGKVERGWSHTSEFVGNIWSAVVAGMEISLNNLIGWFQKAWSLIRNLSSKEFAAIDAETEASNAILANAGKAEIAKRTKEAKAARQQSAALESATTNVIGANLATKANKDIADAKAQLAALTAKAAQAKKDHDLKAGPKFDPANFNMGGDMIKSQVFGSYQAAALEGGGGGGAAEQSLQEQRKANGNWQTHLKAMDELRRSLLKFGLQS